VISPADLHRLAENTVSRSGAGQAVRVGVDAVHIATWERYVRLGGQKLLARTYTAGELTFAQGRIERLATRIAAKEAVLKMLGTGVRGVALLDVEVVSGPDGQPQVVFHGPAERRAEALRLSHVAISLAHENEYAIAFAVGTVSGAEGSRQQ
jgi:holo-[acyl-carrier protein] synthase